MEVSRNCDSRCHVTSPSYNLPETSVMRTGMTKELMQGYATQRKYMETNRRFVSVNTREGAGTQWNLLETGGSLKSVPEVDYEVP